MMIKLQKYSLTAIDKFQPETMSLSLSERASTASMTLRMDDVELTVGDWVQIESGPGEGIVWRVKSVETQVERDTRTVQLEHIVGYLKDLIMFGEVTSSAISGSSSANPTAAQAINYVLNQQSVFRVGVIQYTDSNPYAFNGDTLYAALETISNSLEDCCWYFNFDSYPFMISFTSRIPFLSEMRMSRNVRTLRMTIDKSQMYTRLYPIGANDLHISGNYISKNENLYGTICKTETDQSMDSEEKLLAWATARLNKHCEPYVTVSISGLELAELTGESLDKLVVGSTCRVPLPELGTTITERISKLSYSDIVHRPMDVTVTLANERPDVASIVKQQQQTASRTARTSAKKAGKDHAWIVDTETHVGMVAEAVAGEGADKDWSRVSSVMVDGKGINARVIETEGTLGTITGSDLWMDKDHITGVTGQFSKDANGVLHIVSGSGLLMDRDGASFGVYDSGNLTGGVVVQMINGQSTATISASSINIQGVVNALEAKDVYVKDFGAHDGEFTGTLNVLGDTTLLGVQADEVTVNGLYLYDGDAGTEFQVLDATVSGNVLTITKTDGSTVNFSKATSLSGGWDGGIYTATAKQNNTTVGTVSTALATTLVDGEWSTDAQGNRTYASYTGYIGYIHDTYQVSSTGRSLTISTLAAYTAGRNAVSITGPTWSSRTGEDIQSNSNTATFSTNAPTPKTASLGLYIYPDDWDGNTRLIYMSHTDTYTEANRIAKYTVDATVRYNAGQNAVTISDPAWSSGTGENIQSNSNTATFSTSAPTPRTKSLGLYIYPDDWDGNTRLIYMSHTDTYTEANRIAKYTVDATVRYNAGKNAVTITGPTWSSATGTGIQSNSNTATFSTSAPTPRTASLGLYVYPGDWSGNTRTIYMSHTDTYTEAYRIAKTTIDATVRYNAGQNAVTISDPTWSSPTGSSISSNSNTATFSTSAPTPKTKSLGLYIYPDDWSGNTRTVYLSHTDTSTEAYRLAKYTIDASARYTAGQNAVSITGPVWTNATGSGIQTNSNTATFSTSAPTARTASLGLYIYPGDWSGNTRTIYMSHTDTSTEANRIAKYTVDASARYTAGQNAVSITGPTWSSATGSSIASNSNTATFSTNAPTARTASLGLYIYPDDWDGNSRTVYMSHTDTSTEGNRIAKYTVNAQARYDAGYTAGYNAVTITGPSWGRAPGETQSSNANTLSYTAGNRSTSLDLFLTPADAWNGNTRTVYITHTNSLAANRIAQISVDASSRYTAGQNAVSITGPTWSSATGSGISSNSNTATFSTNAPTARTASLGLYLYPDDWNGNSRTIYMAHTDTSTEAYRIAKYTVNAQSRYDAGVAAPITSATWGWAADGSPQVAIQPQNKTIVGTDRKLIAIGCSDATKVWAEDYKSFTQIFYAYDAYQSTPVITTLNIDTEEAYNAGEAQFTAYSFAKVYKTDDTIYYGKFYDANGHALTNSSYYWYGYSSNFNGGQANARLYRK